MNWLRILLDSVIVCVAFNGVAAFVWLLDPVGFSIMLPKGIHTPKEKLTKAQMKPLRMMEAVLYPILLAYIILSAYEAGITGFWHLFGAAYIENLAWNFGDFFLLDWFLRAKYTDRVMVPGTEKCEMWKTGPWMKKFGIVDHWVKGPILCIFLALFCAGIGLLIR